MSDQPNRRRAAIVSDFTDSGTGESFTAGAEHLLDAGAFANYEASGLVTASAPRPAPRAAAPAKPKRTKKAAAKPATGVIPAPAATSTEAGEPAA